MTKRLYETHPELDLCPAVVLSCEPDGDSWLVELDQTVLFPAGGGQLCDRGTLDQAPVSAVLEDGGRIFHRCSRPFPVGSDITVELDRAVRLYHSQQHTGEHILSHAFWQLFGAKNIGFHSDEELITIDLDQELDRAQCAQAERFANEQIWRNARVRILYRHRDEMDDLNIRKVTDKADGLLRVVAIDGGDICTCCGTHVERTGSVGIIKLVSLQRHRGGTRLEAVCGSRALEDCCARAELVYRLSCSLSCGADSMEARIDALKAENRALSTRLHACTARLMDYTAAEALRSRRHSGDQSCVLYALDGTSSEAKQLLRRLTAWAGTLAGVLYPDGDRVGYLIAASDGVRLSCRDAAAVINRLFCGKGGGSDHFAQGSGQYTADWKKLVQQAECTILSMM